MAAALSQRRWKRGEDADQSLALLEEMPLIPVKSHVFKEKGVLIQDQSNAKSVLFWCLQASVPAAEMKVKIYFA